MELGREFDEGALDWDAAFEALVAPLRPPRYRRVARAAGQLALAVALLAVSTWMLISMVAEPLGHLGRPWR
ncbi:MAG TPA: hypothetical protein VKB57_03105 [Acidimicrobiales bacterium]|nr:hypothetical protein [Acidimicrobiales bacterium]